MVQPYPAARPSGVTAIFAGVLALLGGVWQLFGVFWFGWFPTVGNYLSKALGLAAGLSLVLGGVLLLTRKPAGRLLCVLGAGLVILVKLVIIVLDVVPPNGFYLRIGGPQLIPSEFWRIEQILLFVPPIVTIVLALLPATARWIRPPAPLPPYPQTPYPYPPGAHPPYQQQPYQQGGRPQGW
jgi:hypothetical protein